MLTDEQKKEVREIIDTKGVDLIEDRETAKEELKILAESVKEKYDIPVGKFNKMCEFAYLGNKEEEKMKALQVFDLFEDICEGEE